MSDLNYANSPFKQPSKLPPAPLEIQQFTKDVDLRNTFFVKLKSEGRRESLLIRHGSTSF